MKERPKFLGGVINSIRTKRREIGAPDTCVQWGIFDEAISPAFNRFPRPNEGSFWGYRACGMAF